MMTINAAIPTPLDCQSVGVWSVIRNKYAATTTACQHTIRIYVKDSPTTLLLINESKTDCTAKATGKKYFGLV